MNEFNQNLINKVKLFAENNEDEDEDEQYSFLRFCFANLEEREGSDLKICSESYPQLRASVDGFYYDEDTDSYTLFQSIYSEFNDSCSTLTEEEFYNRYNEIKNTVLKACEGSYDDFDSSSMTYDICEHIHNAYINKKDILINFYSNYFIPDECKEEGIVSWGPDRNGRSVSAYIKIYDLEDLTEKFQQLNQDNAILDCSEKFNSLISAIKISSTTDFDVYMCSMRGDWLARLYKEDGVRLLEPNVRSYLKRTSKTNAGIFETIKVNPENFVTYNNGLTAVATEAIFEGTDGLFVTIRKLVNFQIVNGGQTTATLAEAAKESDIRGNLVHVTVPVKLTVVKNLANSSRLISDISVFSNTQTAIKKSDPPSNLPFFIAIKKLSDECISNDGGKNYVCYFERTAGEYFTELRRNNNSKTFSNSHPASLRFNKIEMANAINSWEQTPYITCLGREKSFQKFTEIIKNQLHDPDQSYFKKAYALIILMRYMDKRARKLSIQYKSVVVAHALALLSRSSDKRLNLLEMWDTKEVNPELYEIIDDCLTRASGIIQSSSESEEPRMYARKEICWQKLLRFTVDIPAHLLVDSQNIFFAENEHLLYIQSDEHLFDSQIWYKLILWNEKKKVLNNSQTNMARTMRTKSVNKDYTLTKKQRAYAIDIFLAAAKSGFNYL